MTQHRLRLVEQSILEGSGDFTVEADTPELAAAILVMAHEAARETYSSLVVLADGQCRRIEPREVIDNKLFCLRLDETGDEIGGEIKPDDGPPQLNMETPDSPCSSNTEPQPC